MISKSFKYWSHFASSQQELDNTGSFLKVEPPLSLFFDYHQNCCSLPVLAKPVPSKYVPFCAVTKHFPTLKTEVGLFRSTGDSVILKFLMQPSMLWRTCSQYFKQNVKLREASLKHVINESIFSASLLDLWS